MRRQLTTSLRTTTARALAAGTLAAALAVGTAGIASADTAAASASPDTSSLWSAIAVSYDTGNTGYAANYPSRSAAAAAAKSRCSARDCQSVVEVSNGCAAVAQAPDLHWGWAYARGLGTAERYAENAAGSRARLIGYSCSGYYTN